jgi:hypothetical protein
VGLLLSIVAICVGLAVGAWVGYAVGVRLRGRKVLIWVAAGVGLLIVWAVDLVGLVTGHQELSTGSLGLMAGLLTGAKYGAFPSVRFWEKAPPPAPAAPGPAPKRGDAPEPEGADASREARS